MFKNSELWLDTNGRHINAHGGGMLFFGDRYYWYGEHKGKGWSGRLAFDGVHAYSSDDLTSWQDEGLVLRVVEDPDSPICSGCRIERPKVIYCAATGQFVMWFHSTDENHTLAKSGVAVADSPLGPFRFVRAFRPGAGHWPLNADEEIKDPASIAEASAEGEASFCNGCNDRVPRYNIYGRDVEEGQMARDQTLFVDDDGSAYHIYASEHNSTLHIAKLTDDYLDHSGELVRLFPGRWHEAPALFKHEGLYYLLTSGCTSWDPNPAHSAVCETIFGDWRELGNPCRGVNSVNHQGGKTTFGCQSTFVFPISGTDCHIAMFDEWCTESFDNSRYVWMPVQFVDGGFQIPWQDSFMPEGV